MSNDTDTNPEAAALRGKRPAKRATPPIAAGTTALSRDTTVEPTTVYDAMSARSFTLFDPREKAPIIEIGGHVPEADLKETYVRSEFDAYETLVPAGCVTGVSRMLWQQGQHVRRDIYERYVQMYRSEPQE